MAEQLKKVKSEIDRANAEFTKKEAEAKARSKKPLHKRSAEAVF